LAPNILATLLLLGTCPNNDKTATRLRPRGLPPWLADVTTLGLKSPSSLSQCLHTRIKCDNDLSPFIIKLKILKRNITYHTQGLQELHHTSPHDLKSHVQVAHVMKGKTGHQLILMKLISKLLLACSPYFSLIYSTKDIHASYFSLISAKRAFEGLF
jgi:hypothetical protein